MKKIIVVALIILVFTVSSCKNNNSDIVVEFKGVVTSINKGDTPVTIELNGELTNNVDGENCDKALITIDKNTIIQKNNLSRKFNHLNIGDVVEISSIDLITIGPTGSGPEECLIRFTAEVIRIINE